MKEGRLDKEDLQDKYEDSLFAVLMDEITETEGQWLIAENERLENDSNFKLPDGLESRCEKTISNVLGAKKRRNMGQKALKSLGKVAILIVVCSITFAVLLNNVSALRISVWKILKLENANSTNIAINESGEQRSENGNIKIPADSYLPTWVPDGYELMSFDKTETVVTAVFLNNKDNPIYYYEFGNSQVLGVNTNNSYNVEDIKINEFEGLLASNSNEISVTWVDSDRGILSRIRTTNIEKETIIKIAESVKKY